jgi:hypothetical protein
LMEYIETFLVAHRLTKEMGVDNIWPLGFTPNEFIRAILDVVGRSISGGEEPRGKLRYYPRPHLQTEVDTPFVDFAGFLVVLLLDYLKWVGGGGDQLAKAAFLEVHEAIRFLLAPATYIEDGSGVGWSFVPKGVCNEKRWPLRQHRHILPTAWAVVAIQKYSTILGADPKLKEIAIALLPRVLDWVKQLRTENGLFRSSERKEPLNLAGHNYVTETLLTLSDHGVSGAEDLTAEALDRFLIELSQPTAREEFEMNLAYPVAIANKPQMQYGDRTTWATCLATLALGTDFLVKQGGSPDQLALARMRCNEMAAYVLLDRRQERGIWQKSGFQFHWTMTAVEALLRTTRYAQQEVFDTSVDAIVQAVDLILDDNKFKDALRSALLRAIRKASSFTTMLPNTSDVDEPRTGVDL